MEAYRIAELREMTGLLQGEIAKELGLSRITINRYEVGKTKMKPFHERLFRELVNDIERISFIKADRRKKRTEARRRRVEDAKRYGV